MDWLGQCEACEDDIGHGANVCVFGGADPGITSSRVLKFCRGPLNSAVLYSVYILAAVQLDTVITRFSMLAAPNADMCVMNDELVARRRSRCLRIGETGQDETFCLQMKTSHFVLVNGGTSGPV